MKTSSPHLTLLALLLFLPLSLSSCLRPDALQLFSTESRYPERTAPTASELLPAAQQPQFPDATRMPDNEAGNGDLSVEQAIQHALTNNQNLLVEQFNPLIAGTFEAIERGVYDPELFAELEVAEEKRSEVSSSNIRSSVQENAHTAAVGLRQKLPTGTQLEASAAQESSDPSNKAREQNLRMGLTVTQSLLRGFGPAVNLVSIRQAELQTAVSNYELRAITESLLAETEIAYWNFVLAGRKIDIFERSLAVARQQLDDIEQRIEVGTLPRIEAAAAHTEVARREQALIDVRSTLEETRLTLLWLMHPDMAGQFDRALRATSKAEIQVAPIDDLDERLQLAAQSRPDLNEARLRVKQNRLETIITRNGLLPKLELFITLGKTGYAESFSNSVQDLDGSNFDASTGIKLSHFLNNRQAKGQDLAARASWRQAAEAVKNLQQLVARDVRLAVNEFERSRQQITASQTTRLLQEETLNAEMERFKVGVSTALLVAQAQRDLLESSIAEVEAIINCRQALVKLYLAEGTLLERRGITLAAAPLHLLIP